MTVNDDRTDQASDDHQRKLQRYASNLLGKMQMLVRNARLYDPDNAIFQRPLVETADCMNQIVLSEGRLELNLAGESFYLNGSLISLDARTVISLKGLREEMERCQVGGFFLDKPIEVQDLKNLIYVFSRKDDQPLDESGVSGRKLAALKLRRFEKIKEILKQVEEITEEDATSGRLDRKRYSLLVYARTVRFMKRFLFGLIGEGPLLQPTQAGTLVREMVDVSFDHHNQFLGLITAERGADYLAQHSVAVAMLSIVFGVEVGLSKEQLRQLGFAALFHDVGRVLLPAELVDKMDGDTPFEKRMLAGLGRSSTRLLLRFGLTNPLALHVLCTSNDCRTAFGKPVSDLQGITVMVEKTAELSPYTKIVSIADMFHTLHASCQLDPDLVFELLNNQFKHHFDPLYLKIFGHLVAGIRSRHLSQHGDKVELF
ncbi:MAG: hypothetical protein DRI34_07285 [Deltaproteobacteria bacterium]|nr:MAG: hypothetical protein DRI34_07285 [Deltaproteobacteria bacterium]